MALIFKPNGSLDLATAATDLPAQNNNGVVYSEALTRCKNLRNDRRGLLTVRDGSSKINSSAFLSNAELVSNGVFDSDLSGWTVIAGTVSWSAGTMLLSAPSVPTVVQQAIVVAAQEHLLSFDIIAPTAALLNVSIRSGNGVEFYNTDFSASGNYTVTFIPTATVVYLRFVQTGPVDIAIDNVSIKLSTESVNFILEQGGNRYVFASSRIYRNESSIISGTANAQWSAISYNAWNDATQQIYALNGVDRKRIEGANVYEWGIATPANAPTLAATGTGLTGTYKAKYTYCRKVGSVVVSESNPSPESGSQSLTNQALRVTFTAPTDSQITHIRIYRTSSGGLIYYYDQDLAAGGASYVDTTTSNANLGTEVEVDHDRPLVGGIVLGPAFDGTVFILKDNRLYYSKPKQPEYWPALYYLEVSIPQFPLKTGVFHNGQLYVLTASDIYLIQGTGHGNMIPIKLSAKTGAQGIFGAISVKGKGIYHTGRDGIYLFAGEDIKLSEQSLEPIFRGETINDVPGITSMNTAWLYNFGNYLWFGYSSSTDYPAHFLLLNLDTNRLTYFTYNDGSQIKIRVLATDYTNNRILAGDTIGFLRVLNDASVTTDSGQAISWEVQSMDYTLQTRRHFPRWAKYDVDAASASDCSGVVVVDGSALQTHSIGGTRDVRYRHISTGNGKRCALKISGTGPATIYAAEVE